MKIAVTGASGHVGTNLCRMLIDKGHDVRVLIHNSNKGLEGLRLEFIKGDVTREKDLRDLCRGCEIVYHLAAFISIRKRDSRCDEINLRSCINLINAARAEKVKKIIHFSSIHAFSQEPLDQVLDETRAVALNSKASYDLSKALSQKLMIEASSPELEIVVLNPTSILGPNDFKPSLQGNAIIRFYKGYMPSLIPGGYDWVDVRDVCIAAINAIDKATPGECYLLSGSWQSLKTLAETVQKLGGHRAPRLCLPLSVAWVGAIFLNLHSSLTGRIPLYTAMSLETVKMSHRNISHSKASDHLGYYPRPFSETMTDTVKWFKENKFI